MTYEQAIEYIHSVSWTFCKPGLQRIGELCSALGNPEDSLRFIHVTGTNGKGSTSAMLASVLLAAGLKVGLYTSPYIVKFNERMQVNGESISDGKLAALTEYVRPIADKMEDKPTEFELITAIAFEYFKREGCDIVVLEAGMGGRLDSTNIIKDTDFAVITNVALDHTAILGDTVEKIATEKAGIIKRGTKVIYGGEPSGSVYDIIKARADEMGATLTTPDYSRIVIEEQGLSGTRFSYGSHKGLEIGLLGSYQPQNAALALEALDAVISSGIGISEEQIKAGLSSARWPARFEIISKNPLVIFDGAHNPHGVTAAVESITRYFPDVPVTVVTGVLADKDYDFIAKKITRVAGKVFTLTPDNSRALSATDYALHLCSLGADATPTGSVYDAVRLAADHATKTGTPVVCLGSLYTYAEVISAISRLSEQK